jgi:hypothetical protein
LAKQIRICFVSNNKVSLGKVSKQKKNCQIEASNYVEVHQSVCRSSPDPDNTFLLSKCRDEKVKKRLMNEKYFLEKKCALLFSSFMSKFLFHEMFSACNVIFSVIKNAV